MSVDLKSNGSEFHNLKGTISFDPNLPQQLFKHVVLTYTSFLPHILNSITMSRSEIIPGMKRSVFICLV